MSTNAAATWQIVCDQGKTLTRVIRYGQRISGVFVPFDNSAYEARMMWKRNFDSVSPVVDISSVAGDIVLGGPTGEITFTVSAATMATLNGKYVFDLELYDDSGPTEIVIAPVRGTATVRPEVTS
jgi:hypothetical protein